MTIWFNCWGEPAVCAAPAGAPAPGCVAIFPVVKEKLRGLLNAVKIGRDVVRGGDRVAVVGWGVVIRDVESRRSRVGLNGAKCLDYT
jgi:hypothetical protein